MAIALIAVLRLKSYFERRCPGCRKPGALRLADGRRGGFRRFVCKRCGAEMWDGRSAAKNPTFPLPS